MNTAVALALTAYCDICASIPCVNPSFCEVCRIADLARGYEVPSIEVDVQNFAQRTRDLVDRCRAGTLTKAAAIDAAFNYALALGLHYRLAKTADDFLQDKPRDLIQRVLAAAFAGGAS